MGAVRPKMAITDVRIVCFGAHPDDCEIKFGGTAIKFLQAGHAVKFVALTNGEAGHHLHAGPALAEIRRLESEEAARRLGVEATVIMPNHDGQLLPTVEARNDVVREIRSWEADMVFSHRPWDYHPDHRYTGQLVQDSAYLVLVPRVCPDTPPLRRNPIFLYLEDGFQTPVPFFPDIAVDITDVWDRKVDSLDAHVSQVYEWLPWVDGVADQVPKDQASRKAWLSKTWSREPSGSARAALGRRYGSARAREVRHAECFQICEYGRQPSAVELDEAFPL